MCHTGCWLLAHGCELAVQRLQQPGKLHVVDRGWRALNKLASLSASARQAPSAGNAKGAAGAALLPGPAVGSPCWTHWVGGPRRIVIAASALNSGSALHS